MVYSQSVSDKEKKFLDIDTWIQPQGQRNPGKQLNKH
jgi:hypothetical protein